VAGVAGLPLSKVSPLGTVRGEMLREVLRTGVPQHGEDRRLTAEEGATVLRWHAYRPLPDHVLVIIDVWPSGPPLQTP
jgi:hypothetical protein